MQIPSEFKLKSIIKDECDVYIVRAFSKKHEADVILKSSKESNHRNYHNDLPEINASLTSCKNIERFNHNGIQWDVYEERPGVLLSDHLSEANDDTEKSFKISLSLCQTAKFMIENSIDIHKLNPDNIIVDNEKTYLLDSLSGEMDKQSQRFYKDNYVTYIPPEVILNTVEDVTDRTYVYTLGAIIFRLFSGRPHVHLSNSRNIIRSLLISSYQYDDSGRNKDRDGFYSFIKNTIHISPERRYSRIDALRYDLNVLSKFYSKHGHMNARYSPSPITIGTLVNRSADLTELDKSTQINNWLKDNGSRSNIVEVQGEIDSVCYYLDYIKNSNPDLKWVTLDLLNEENVLSALASLIESQLIKLKNQGKRIYDETLENISSIEHVSLKKEESTSIESDITSMFNSLFKGSHVISIVNEGDIIEPLDSNTLSSLFHRVIIVKNKLTPLTLDSDPIRINALNSVTTRDLIASLLSEKCKDFDRLVDVTFRMSRGIPLLIESIVSDLYKSKVLTYQYEKRRWLFDCNFFDEINFTLQKSNISNVVEFENDHSRRVLGLASCLLTSFNVELLIQLIDKDELTSECITRNIEQGYLKLNQHTGEIIFSDKSLKNKIYSNLNIEEKTDNHHKIAKLLTSLDLKPEEYQHICEHILACHRVVINEADVKAFSIILQQSAEQNIYSGRYDIPRKQYNALLFFYDKLIDDNDIEYWKTLQYGAAKAHCYCYDYDGMMTFITNIIDASSELHDKIECTLLEGNYHTLCSNHDKAIKLCYRCLDDVECDLPKSTTVTELTEAINALNEELDLQELESSAQSSSCTDQHLFYLNRIVEQFLGSLLVANPIAMSYLVTRLLSRMYEVRQFIISPAIFTTFGLAIVRYTPFITLGYSVGELGVKFARDNNRGIQTYRATARHCYAVRHFSLPIQSSLEELFEAAVSAEDAGDIEYAAINMEIYCINSFISGMNLSVTSNELEWGKAFLTELGQVDIVKRVNALHNLVSYLVRGEGATLSDLSCYGHYSTQELPSTEDRLGFAKIHCYEVIGNALMANTDRAFIVSTHDALNAQAPPKTTLHLFYEFFRTIVLISTANTTDQSDKQWGEISTSCDMFQSYSEHSPENFLAKAQMLQSGLFESKGMFWHAWGCLVSARESANRYGNLFEQALVAELSALFWQRQKDSDLAQNFASQAATTYESWGATYKANQLKQQMLKKSTTLNRSLYKDIDIARDLEKRVVVEANKIITTENDLNNVSINLLRLLIETTGADSASLVMRNDENRDLLYRTVAQDSKLRSIHQPSFVSDTEQDQTEQLVFKLVERSRSPIVSHDIGNDDRVNQDQYLKVNNFLSLVAIPIFYKSQYRGVISLLSLALRDMFSSNTVDMLTVLASHISFALENAKMFNQLVTYSNELENLVDQRTIELKNTIEELRLTQEKLVEKEKMLELGQLVAGIAHEINTPLGIMLTANSLIMNETHFVQDAMAASTLTSTGLSDSLEQVLSASDLNANSIKRISRLVDNFKAMAVEKESHVPTQFSLKELVDLLVNKYQLDNDFSTQVSIEIDQQLEIFTYYDLLGVVITNLFENSLLHGTKSLPNGQIIIHAERVERAIKIVVRDNGAGISAGDEKKIFSPFYTTNRGGGNAGIGLTLVFNLVTRILEGEISVSPRKNSQWTSFNIILPLKVSAHEK